MSGGSYRVRYVLEHSPDSSTIDFYEIGSGVGLEEDTLGSALGMAWADTSNGTHDWVEGWPRDAG